LLLAPSLVRVAILVRSAGAVNQPQVLVRAKQRRATGDEKARVFIAAFARPRARRRVMRWYWE